MPVTARSGLFVSPQDRVRFAQRPDFFYLPHLPGGNRQTLFAPRCVSSQLLPLHRQKSSPERPVPVWCILPPHFFPSDLFVLFLLFSFSFLHHPDPMALRLLPKYMRMIFLVKHHPFPVSDSSASEPQNVLRRPYDAARYVHIFSVPDCRLQDPVFPRKILRILSSGSAAFQEIHAAPMR